MEHNFGFLRLQSLTEYMNESLNDVWQTSMPMQTYTNERVKCWEDVKEDPKAK